MKKLKPIICLLGPTASGKTPLAVEIVKRFPCEIISVDSAMVYKHMDIGTAKPDADILEKAPHRLINLLDPKDSYSAGQFRQDALREIENIIAKEKVPLLVGGTMMYFKTLQQGLAKLPRANAVIRKELQDWAKEEGWQNLHQELTRRDPESAKRIHPNDSQRIQRALEVFLITGEPISTLQAQETSPLAHYDVKNFIIAPQNRDVLHQRIEARFNQMLDAGFLNEVECLYSRGNLSQALPSIRSVGYKQAWEYYDGKINYADMQSQAIAATRQLAKRQLTWLRAWENAQWFDTEEADFMDQVFGAMESDPCGV